MISIIKSVIQYIGLQTTTPVFWIALHLIAIAMSLLVFTLTFDLASAVFLNLGIVMVHASTMVLNLHAEDIIARLIFLSSFIGAVILLISSGAVVAN